MEDKIAILKEAVGTGEVIKIKYFGSLQPGSIREIVPQEIAGNKIRAHCLTSGVDHVLNFIIDKIEIIPEDKNKDPKLPETLYQLHNSYKDEWEKNGWFVVYDRDLDSIGLFAGNKNEAVPDICIVYEEDLKNTNGYLQMYVDGELIPPSKEKPWTVKCKGKKASSFVYLDRAIKKFLEHCNNFKPEHFLRYKSEQTHLADKQKLEQSDISPMTKMLSFILLLALLSSVAFALFGLMFEHYGKALFFFICSLICILALWKIRGK
ncbi:MAG: hypothetical protein LBU89_03750 [Fibromonadaceae bacterium]|nr:hypothetical protein [Fibromonadaceae bacterium]